MSHRPIAWATLVAGTASIRSKDKLMATKLKQSLGAYGIIAGLSALLVVLGILQFRWSNQLRTMDVQRKQAALQAGMNGFREDFRRELAGICMSFGFRPPDQAAAVEDLYAQDCGDWARSSDHRDLVANFYLWENEKGGSYSFLQFNPQQDAAFKATDCPARLGLLCKTSDLAGALMPVAENLHRWDCGGEFRESRSPWCGPSLSRAGAFKGIMMVVHRTAPGGVHDC